MNNIGDTLRQLYSELPSTVKLVAVSKFHPFESIEEAYAAGQRIFAESRPQELLAKVKHIEEIRRLKCDQAYMSDIQWHFIGHLQTNKLKMVLPYVSLVQSVDSVRLLDAIQNWASANGRVIDVLLEPHVAAEETKQGFTEEEIYTVLKKATGQREGSVDSTAPFYGNICFRGIMGMATFTDDESVVRADFAALRTIFDKCRSRFLSLAPDFTELSIGMSDDYRLAMDNGSTMVRIGSRIFGLRV